MSAYIAASLQRRWSILDGHIKKIEIGRDKDRPACYIIGAGSFFGLKTYPRDGDLVIAADGGVAHLLKLGLKADIVLGDFDSETETEAARYSKESGAELRKLNVIKDVSDSKAAIDIGRERGYDLFYLYGCTGGRTDHTMASIQDMAALSKDGIEAYIFGDKEAITAITDGSIVFPETMTGYLSVFSHGDIAKGVYETGLRYELSDAELSNTFPLGLSNEFLKRPATISVREGTLLIYFQIR